MWARTDAATVASFDGLDDGVDVLQRRLRRLLGVFGAGNWIGLLTHIVLVWLVPGSETGHPWFILSCFIAGAVVVTVGFWIVRPQRRCSMRLLLVVDAGLALFITWMLASVIVVGTGRVDEAFMCMVIVDFIILGHTLAVPRTWQHTLALSLGCVLPTYGAVIIVAIAFPERLNLPPSAWIANATFVLGIPVALATISSRVMTRLRQQVREAQRLGQYTLGEKIAEGGIGSVYRAHHAMLRRPTAIKLLRDQLASEDAIRQFEREVQITAELTDPHVVAVYDYGRSRDGTFYYAMEYLDGIDLERLVRDYGAQPVGRVVSILRQVCDALAEAHGRGLIHRDIKPANILLCERGMQRDVAKVVDFGLVQRFDIDGASTGIAGTPGYLAPEAIAEQTIGAASDLYSLGAVAYYLLTGQTVFEADSFVSLCAQHLTEEAPPPSARAQREIPASLDALVMSCLAKDPAARPSSAMALAVALDALSVPPWRPEDVRAWWSAFRARPARASRAPIDPRARTLAVAGS
ncbi:MAG TPA: serine/threonine-protein kinase [Kofleriaceae bacterium]|nr:serine/threonine-protein kinase [Kofleriaceae bacterium]